MVDESTGNNKDRVRISFTLARGPLSAEERTKFIADLARLAEASPEEITFIGQHEEPGKTEIGAIYPRGFESQRLSDGMQSSSGQERYMQVLCVRK